MSAWQIFSSLASTRCRRQPDVRDRLALYKKATIHLQNGRTRHQRPDKSPSNVYVQGVKVNGKSQSKTYLTQDQLAKGGTIDFDLGRGRHLGTKPKDAPPSITQGRQPARPVDGRTNQAECPTSSERRLRTRPSFFDNNSLPQVTLGGLDSVAAVRPDRPTARAQMYTRTSSDAALTDQLGGEGSNDGTSWTTWTTAPTRSLRGGADPPPGVHHRAPRQLPLLPRQSRPDRSHDAGRGRVPDQGPDRTSKVTLARQPAKGSVAHTVTLECRSGSLGQELDLRPASWLRSADERARCSVAAGVRDVNARSAAATQTSRWCGVQRRQLCRRWNLHHPAGGSAAASDEVSVYICARASPGQVVLSHGVEPRA